MVLAILFFSVSGIASSVEREYDVVVEWVVFKEELNWVFSISDS